METWHTGVRAPRSQNGHPMFDRILVPLDGTPFAETAIPYAELIPSRAVILLHVFPPFGAQHPAITRRAAVSMARCADRFARQGREVERLLLRGEVRQTLIAEAARADLIVMATHGRGVAERGRLGSTADWAARSGPRPTLLVRPDPAGRSAVAVARIVVPLDGSAFSETALEIAEELAGDLGVPISLVRGVADSVDGPEVSSPETAADAVCLDGHVRRLHDRDVPASAHVLTGDIASSLIGELGPTDIVVIASRTPAGLERWLPKSTSEALVRLAHAPVLLVCPPPQPRAHTVVRAAAQPVAARAASAELIP